MRDKQTKFVFFDIGGVFFSYRFALKKLAAKHGVSKEDLGGAFKKYDPAACRGEISPSDLWSKYRKELDISSPSGFHLRDFWMENLSLIKESHLLAKEVSKKYPVGLLTNVYSGWFEETFKKGFIPDLNYKVVLKSCQLGLIKPEEGIYKAAQKRVGVKKEEILFVDDTLENVLGAEKVGWKAIRFNEKDPKSSADKVKKALGFTSD